VSRDGTHHKEMGMNWLTRENKKEREVIEFNHGARFSELFRLPYFNPVSMHLIDPMHNLMLGKYYFLCLIQHSSKVNEL